MDCSHASCTTATYITFFGGCEAKGRRQKLQEGKGRKENEIKKKGKAREEKRKKEREEKGSKLSVA